MNHLNNPTSLKSRFASRFLRALTKINADQKLASSSSSSSSSPREIFLRYRRIKVAADRSMAYSVRSRRAWRRAMLSKLRSRRPSRRRGRGRQAAASSIRSRLHRAVAAKKHEKENKGEGTRSSSSGEEAGDELRELVPGGEDMDLYNLLDETAHYIKCLSTQVQVMRKTVDFYSL